MGEVETVKTYVAVEPIWNPEILMGKAKYVLILK